MSMILVIEDDPRIQKALHRQFTTEGYEVHVVGDGTGGLAACKSLKPAGVVLDLMLPGMSGRDVCREIKAWSANTPVVVLSAVSEVADKVLLLELGADDYVTKPFSIRELLARVKAVLRRAHTVPKEQDKYLFGEIEVDMRSCQVLRNGRALDFSSKEFDLLKFFLCHAGETLSRDRLLQDVWGYDHFPTTRTVDAHIVRLRQKLEPTPEDPRYILTVHGTGYKFVG